MVLQGSSAVIASADEMRLARSKVAIANAGEMTAEHDVRVGMLTTGSVKSQGDVRATVMVAGDVTAGGDVNVKFDAPSAFALGAGFALVLILLRGLLRRVF
jgi:hypothetical protein